MYVFHQENILIVVCGNRAVVKYKDMVTSFRLEDADRALGAFPEKFRKFVKQHLALATGEKEG